MGVVMEHRFRTIGHFLRALLRRPDQYKRFDVSPGWAVDALGFHRSRVPQLIDQGDLDAVRCDDGIVLLDQREVMAYKRAVLMLPSRERIRAGRQWRAKKAATLASTDDIFGESVA